MKINFFDLYESIKNKLQKEKDEKGFKNLKNKIKENKNFSQAFIIYNHLKNKNADFEVIKEFSNGINISQSELKSLKEFFNISDIKTKKINESFNNLVLYKNKSLGTNLSTIKEDEEKVKQYLLDDSDTKDEDLTFEEQSALQIIETKDYKKLNKLTGYYISLTEKLDNSKEKNIIRESFISSIKNSKDNLKESTLNIYSLYNRIQQLTEGKFGGEQKIKTGKIGIFRDSFISTEEDANNPEYIIVQLKTDIPLLSKVESEKQAECKEIKKVFISTLKNVLKRNLNNNTFELGNVITDTSALMIMKNCSVITQIFLEVKRDEKEQIPLRKHSNDLKPIILKIEKELKETIPQLNKKINKVEA